MLRFIAVVLIVPAYLIYSFAPGLNIEPQAYQPQFMKLEGPLAVNQDLEKSQIILMDKVPQPESLAYKDGLLYASLDDGRIVSIKDDKILKTVADTSDGSKVPGRPMGLRFWNDDLYLVDGERGLLKVDVKTGKINVLVSKEEIIEGKTLHFPNDMDIIDGEIYFSDITTKWNSTNLWYCHIEHSNTGRVYKYKMETGKIEVVLDNLYVPNGIQVTRDKKSVLIAEYINHRILRHYISGPKKGQTEIFVQLPGEPDNIRQSSNGGYWVPLIAGRDIDSLSWIDRLWPYPSVVKAISKTVHALGTALEWINQYISSTEINTITSQIKSGMWILTLFNVNHPILLELSAEGEILRSFHSNTEKYGKISQALEIDGHLYLGSFGNSHILKLKL